MIDWSFIHHYIFERVVFWRNVRIWEGPKYSFCEFFLLGNSKKTCYNEHIELRVKTKILSTEKVTTNKYVFERIRKQF